MAERYKTLGQTTLAEDLDASETGVDVTSAAALRSSYSVGDTYRIKVDSEIMIVTAEATNTLTVTRGAEGTTGATHVNGATVTQVITAAALDQVKLDANIAGKSTNRGNAAGGAIFNITAANGTFEDTGLQVSLPAAGTYFITYNCRSILETAETAINYIVTKLKDTTAAAYVADSERLCQLVENLTARQFQQNSGFTYVITAAAATDIEVWASRNYTSVAPTVARIASDSAGRSVLQFVKLAD